MKTRRTFARINFGLLTPNSGIRLLHPDESCMCAMCRIIDDTKKVSYDEHGNPKRHIDQQLQVRHLKKCLRQSEGVRLIDLETFNHAFTINPLSTLTMNSTRPNPVEKFVKRHGSNDIRAFSIHQERSGNDLEVFTTLAYDFGMHMTSIRRGSIGRYGC